MSYELKGEGEKKVSYVRTFVCEALAGSVQRRALGVAVHGCGDSCLEVGFVGALGRNRDVDVRLASEISSWEGGCFRRELSLLCSGDHTFRYTPSLVASFTPTGQRQSLP